MKDLILAIDFGTQSVRALIFNPEGEVLARQQTAIQPYYSVKPGWAEQDPEYFWEKLIQTTNHLVAKHKGLIKRVAALALTTQRATLINLDKKAKPLRPAIVWPDQRRTKNFKPIGGLIGLLMRLIGMYETVLFAQGEAEINWLNFEQPEIMQKTDKFLFLSGYLIYRLISEFKDSYASQVGYIPFDYKNRCLCKKGDWHWDAFPIAKEKLPILVPPGKLLGELTSEASHSTGLPAGLPLYAAGADKTCELLGSGCLSADCAGISYGTTATIGTYSRRYFEVIPFIPPYPSAIPNVYNPEFQIYRGFWLVSWFKKEFGLPEIKRAKVRGVEPEVFLEELLNESPPGSLGLILQPTWSPGVKIPGPEAKGAVIGFGDAHTRSHLYRSIIEGLCFGLKDGGERIQKSSGIRFKEIRVSGGGSQSHATLQITADVFELPVYKPKVHDTSALGAAIDAAVGCGLYQSFPDAVKAMTHIEKTVEPDKARARLYSELYHEVYKHIYEKLKPYYKKIRKIIGYPD